MQRQILIVDDEPMIRELLKEAFESIGFTVHEAENGREAFRLVREIPFECVLSDLRMPGGDGIELANEIHKAPGPKPKMFLMTGYSDITLQKAQALGVLKIFEKPFNFKDLLQEVSKAVNHGPYLGPA
ncbi:response regulator [Bdellovibrio sp. HCB337]|uniref:response regulator n=1 Tax=Bdellovibrio sp. HCB337 TaxID=3394358 RepID=UPI0039A46C0E